MLPLPISPSNEPAIYYPQPLQVAESTLAHLESPFVPFAATVAPTVAATVSGIGTVLPVAITAGLHIPAQSAPSQVAFSQPTQSWSPNSLLQFDFSQLPTFTRVHDQYQAWGVELEGAITIRPSNPAFISRDNQADTVGLMPVVAHQPITLHFHQNRQAIQLSLLSANQVVIRAYDAGDRLVSEHQVGRYHYCQAIAVAYLQHQIQVQAATIARIEITSQAPFLLRSLVCG